MNKVKSEKVKNITGLGLLTGLVVILQFVSNYVQFGPVSITLSLTPIIVGALIYGPLGGAFLGFINGCIILLAPSTAQFFSLSLPGTLVTVLIKTTVAGFVGGLIFKLMKNKHPKLGSLFASILVPVINTAIFAVCFVLFFRTMDGVPQDNIVGFLFMSLIGINFIIELVINVVLSKVSYYLFTVFERRKRENS